MDGYSQYPRRYRAEQPRPIQPPQPPSGGGGKGWIKWAAGGFILIVLMIAAVIVSSGGSPEDRPSNQPKKEKPSKAQPKPNSWKRGYDVQFAFASNPRGQALVISDVAVAGLNSSRSRLTVNSKAGCDPRYMEKRRWQLRANNPQLVNASPGSIKQVSVFGATCGYRLVFSWPGKLLVEPRRTELWIQIPSKRASRSVALRIAVPLSHRGVE